MIDNDIIHSEYRPYHTLLITPRINHRGLNILMPHKLFNGREIYILLYKVFAKGVSEHMYPSFSNPLSF